MFYVIDNKFTFVTNNEEQDFRLSLKVLQRNNSVCFCILDYNQGSRRKTMW